MRPYIKKIGDGLNGALTAVELARLYQDARDAERKFNVEHYESIISNLSDRGQTIVRSAIQDQRSKSTFSEVDFISLAGDDPDAVREWMRSIITNSTIDENFVDRGGS